MSSNGTATIDLDHKPFSPFSQFEGDSTDTTSLQRNISKRNQLISLCLSLGISFSLTHTGELIFPSSHELTYNISELNSLNSNLYSNPSVKMGPPTEAIDMTNEERHVSRIVEEHTSIIHKPLTRQVVTAKVKYFGPGSTQTRIIENEDFPHYLTPTPLTQRKFSSKVKSSSDGTLG